MPGWRDTFRQVNGALFNLSVLALSVAAVEAIGPMLGADADEWSKECKAAVTEFGFCLLTGLVWQRYPGARLDPEGANYNCADMTYAQRAENHGVSPAELAGCVGLMRDTEAGKYGKPYTQECLNGVGPLMQGQKFCLGHNEL